MGANSGDRIFSLLSEPPPDAAGAQGVPGFSAQGTPRRIAVCPSLAAPRHLLAKIHYAPLDWRLIVAVHFVAYWPTTDVPIALANVGFESVRSTGQCNTACSLSAGVWK